MNNSKESLGLIYERLDEGNLALRFEKTKVVPCYSKSL